MRAIVPSVVVVLAAACGPMDAEPAAAPPQSAMQQLMQRASPQLGPALASFERLTPPGSMLSLDRLHVDVDGSLVALAVESRLGGCQPFGAAPGCAATAWAMRWTGGVWVPFEMAPTSYEACESLGVSALEAVGRPFAASIDVH